MRLATLRKGGIFVLGLLFGASVIFVLEHARIKRAIWHIEKKCERDTIISLGHSLIADVKTYSAVSEFIESNQLARAQHFVSSHALVALQSAWVINNTYGGVLDEDLKPLILEVYPHVKARVDFDFIWLALPQSSLTEMSNFVHEANALVEAHRASKTRAGAKSLDSVE